MIILTLAVSVWTIVKYDKLGNVFILFTVMLQYTDIGVFDKCGCYIFYQLYMAQPEKMFYT
jgi:hypothetical protein